MAAAGRRRWMRMAGVVLSLVVAGCSSTGDPEPDGVASRTEIVRIGVLTGGGAVERAVTGGVTVAAAAANEEGRVVGWDVRVTSESGATPEAAAEAARKLVANDRVAGVVVSLDDAALLAALPVLQEARVLAVAPSGSTLTLTRTSDLRPQRPFDNFFRLAPTTASLGGAAGQFAVRELNTRTVAVLHDGSEAGAAMAAGFSRQANRAQASIALEATIGPDGANSGAVAGQLAGQPIDAVFVGGTAAAVERFAGAAGQAGLRGALLTAAPVRTDAVAAALAAAPMRVFVAETGEVDGGAEFAASWDAADLQGDPPPLAVWAHDAARVVIDAVAPVLLESRTLGSNERVAVMHQAARVSFEGLTGTVTFDDFGDSLHQTVTVFGLTGGEWQAMTTERFLPNQ